MPKSEIEYLKHIKKECDFLLKNKEGISFDEFYNDEVKKRAFVRSLEIIGEASKNLDEEFRHKYYLIPWKYMSKMRDKLIHYYHGIDYEMVWETINSNIPEVEYQIEQILKEISYN